jgi:transcriptional regulator with PAS, ATPase and Fis domain
MSQSSLPKHFRLPEQGQVVIGRDGQADVLLDDQRASRRHALLGLQGATMSIQDLDSANGTWLRDQRLTANQSVTLGLGEAITIGTTTLVVRRNKPAPLPIRAHSHEAFETHLRQICEQAETVQAQFAVARLELAEPGEAAPSTRAIEEPASQTLLPSDMLACYSEKEYEILLLPASLKDAQIRIGTLSAALEARGLKVRVAIAQFPHHGRSADKLVARAHQLLHGDAGRGGRTLIVADPAMKRVYALAERAAPSDACVLILGETGVGKNVLAEHIHVCSARGSKPFVTVNCGGIPASLFESELFGHEKGAFTGASETRKGLIESAHGGTLFLDEIGELPPEIQVKQSRAARQAHS